MSSSYPDRGPARRRGYWVPIAVTLTVATVGVAVWLWNQHKQQQQQHEEEENQGGKDEGQDLDYENADYGDNPAYGASKDLDDDDDPTYNNNNNNNKKKKDNRAAGGHGRPDTAAPGGWGVSGALRRTPSPQQFLAGARKTVAAGMTAVGSALASIREDDNSAYADHETWSEEAEAKQTEQEKGQDRRAIAEATNVAAALSTVSARGPEVGSGSSRGKKTVAIVVSADVDRLDEAFNEESAVEHASILSHIPHDIDFSKIKLYILIYAPNLKESTPLEPTSARPPPSVSSSFSNIEHSQAQTPGDEPKSPPLNTSPSTAHPVFAAMYQQAVALVEKERNVLPFTTPSAHVHILRHIKPEVVYLQESLAGDSGSVVTQLQTWLRHDVVLVVGAESGHGGLADSESEADTDSRPPPEKWWQREDRVGRGRGVVVVDGMRVSDDWTKRVQGRE